MLNLRTYIVLEFGGSPIEPTELSGVVHVLAKTTAGSHRPSHYHVALLMYQSLFQHTAFGVARALAMAAALEVIVVDDHVLLLFIASGICS